MKSDAKIVETNIGKRVMVEDSDGLTQWPILVDGRVLYDRPGRVPKFMKEVVRRLLESLET